MHILSSLKKEEDFDTCYNTDDPWRHYSKWNKTMTKVQIMYDSFNMRFWEQSDLEMISNGGCQRLGHYYSSGYRAAAEGRLWRWMLVMLIQQCEFTKCHRIFKNGYSGKFYMYLTAVIKKRVNK